MEDIDPWRRDVVRWARKAFATGSRFRNGDTLVARITPCLEHGKTALVNFLEEGEVACGSTEFLVLCPHDCSIDRRWLYYLLRSEPFRAEAISSMTGTSGRQRVMREAVEDFPCDLPASAEQVRIGHVLARLDDKIELNWRMSATLEKLARVLFTSWFGALDPERVPEGWTVASLREHLEVVRGLSYTGAGLAEDGVPLHNLDSIYEGGGYKYEGIKHYSGEYRDRHIARAGDLLVVNTEQGFDHLLIGCPAIVPERFGELSLFSADLFRVRPIPGSPLTPRFLYLMLMSPRLRQVIVGYSNGTTVNHLPADALHRPRFAVPPADKIHRFDDLTAPLFAKQEQLQLESETLARLRDLLLPRLMSGEIRLPAAADLQAPAAL